MVFARALEVERLSPEVLEGLRPLLPPVAFERVCRLTKGLRSSVVDPVLNARSLAAAEDLLEERIPLVYVSLVETFVLLVRYLPEEQLLSLLTDPGDDLEDQAEQQLGRKASRTLTWALRNVVLINRYLARRASSVEPLLAVGPGFLPVFKAAARTNALLLVIGFGLQGGLDARRRRLLQGFVERLHDATVEHFGELRNWVASVLPPEPGPGPESPEAEVGAAEPDLQWFAEFVAGGAVG